MTFTITGPGEYQARDGRKVIVTDVGIGACEGTLDGNTYNWTRAGKNIHMSAPRYDIIGPWEEPQPVTPPRELVKRMRDKLLFTHGMLFKAMGNEWFTHDAGTLALLEEADKWLEANP